MRTPVVLVLAKAPLRGQVKTRLCPPCTLDEAAGYATAALRDTLQAAEATGLPVVLAIAGPTPPWVPRSIRVVGQRGATFNDRLAGAWSAVTGPAIQIAMDTPQVTSSLLLDGLRDLDDHDAALGRSTDGGWWALAMRRSEPDVFRGVPMSRCDTGRRQRSSLTARGWRVAELPMLRDVDTWDDARIVAAEAPDTRAARFVRDLGEPRPVVS